MIKDWFLALDGDDIGRRLELHIVTEDPDGLRDFALAFENALNQFIVHIEENLAIGVLLRGGDSLLLTMPESEIQPTISFIKLATKEAEFTFSGGYGRTMREAYFALKIAKATGKNKIIPLTPAEHQ